MHPREATISRRDPAGVLRLGPEVTRACSACCDGIIALPAERRSTSAPSPVTDDEGQPETERLPDHGRRRRSLRSRSRRCTIARATSPSCACTAGVIRTAATRRCTTRASRRTERIGRLHRHESRRPKEPVDSRRAPVRSSPRWASRRAIDGRHALHASDDAHRTSSRWSSPRRSSEHGHRAEEPRRPRQARRGARRDSPARIPTFRAHVTDEETQETVIAGMGELHLEVDRQPPQVASSSSRCEVGAPRVAYRQRLKKARVHVEGKHVKQSGGSRPVRCQSTCNFDIGEKRGASSSIELRSSVAAIPSEYINSVQARASRTRGVARRRRRIPVRAGHGGALRRQGARGRLKRDGVPGGGPLGVQGRDRKGRGHVA